MPEHARRELALLQELLPDFSHSRLLEREILREIGHFYIYNGDLHRSEYNLDEAWARTSKALPPAAHQSLLYPEIDFQRHLPHQKRMLKDTPVNAVALVREYAMFYRQYPNAFAHRLLRGWDEELGWVLPGDLPPPACHAPLLTALYWDAAMWVRGFGM